MHKHSTAVACAFLLIAAGCTQTPPKKAEPEKPLEALTGRSALYRMFNTARGWSPDIQIMRMHSIDMREVKTERGKAPAWEATFVSRGSSRARTYTYSVVESEGNLHKGVFAGLEEGWSGPRGSSKPFPIIAVKTDTDQVYQTALKKAADYEKKHPGLPISFLLEQTSRFPDVTWRVVWGETVGTSNFSVFVDASTGQYLETMR